MSNRCPRIGLALAALAAVGCFDPQSDEVAGGGGVETTEGNVASLAASPAGARVSLIPADFDPLRNTLPDSLTVLADARGVYRFRGLAPGRYNLEAYLPSAGTRCFRPGVVIAKGERNIAGTDTLAASGRLRLSWDGFRRGVLTQKGRRLRLELAGLEADSGGITLDSLPAGLLPPFTFTDAVDSATRVWTDSVRIVPSRVDSVPIREAWAHAALLTFDTTALASDSLEGYPLLVRLASPEFPFSEAAPGGADLRFTTQDSVVLPHAVEGWDSAGGHAEIWVRLKAQPRGGFGSLRMYWGNPAAVSRAGSVFGSASPYTGIWHLNEKISGGTGLMEDAGPSVFRTSAVGLVPETQGVIGAAQRFDGTGAYAVATDAGPVPTQAQLCVSAWIMPDTTGLPGGLLGGEPVKIWTLLSNWQASDSKGFSLVYLPIYDELFLTLGLDTISQVVVPPLDTPINESWHLVAATYDGATITIWLDGKPMNSSEAGPGDLPLPSREYLIGATAAADPQAAKVDFFRGEIDEARVLRSVPSGAWLDLDFRAQNPGSKFIRFQRLR